jgi:uncharacterized membrane protein (UPF0127 family)
MIHIKSDTRLTLMATRRHRQTPVNRLLAGLAALAVTLMAALPTQAQDAPQKLGTVRLNAGMHLINAEVAQTPEQRQIGLMHRPTMPVNDGMLFVFEAPGMNCFWMRNTLLALSIAFVAEDGTIVNVEDMQPQTDASHCPKKPVKYALEMNQGWFTKRGVVAGQKLGGGPFAAK